MYSLKNTITLLTINCIIVMIFTWVGLFFIGIMISVLLSVVCVSFIGVMTFNCIATKNLKKLLLLWSSCIAILGVCIAVEGYYFYNYPFVKATHLSYGSWSISEAKKDSVYLWEYEVVNPQNLVLRDSVSQDTTKLCFDEVFAEYRTIRRDSRFIVSYILNSDISGAYKWWGVGKGSAIRDIKYDTRYRPHKKWRKGKYYKICQYFDSIIPTDTITLYLHQWSEFNNEGLYAPEPDQILDSIVIVRKY